MLVEDDAAVMGALATALELAGYRVVRMDSGKQAIAGATTIRYALVILELSLHDIDSLIVLEALLGWAPDIPILVIGSPWQGEEITHALRQGASDYIPRPFYIQEVVGNVTAFLRKKPPAGEEQCGMTLNYESATATVEGKPLELKADEYKFLEQLYQNMGRVVSDVALMKTLWGPYNNDIAQLRRLAGNLRTKIEADPANPRHILTVLGVGYRLNAVYKG